MLMRELEIKRLRGLLKGVAGSASMYDSVCKKEAWNASTASIARGVGTESDLYRPWMNVGYSRNASEPSLAESVVAELESPTSSGGASSGFLRTSEPIRVSDDVADQTVIVERTVAAVSSDNEYEVPEEVVRALIDQFVHQTRAYTTNSRNLASVRTGCGVSWVTAIVE